MMETELVSESTATINDPPPPPYYINYGMTDETPPPAYEFSIANNNDNSASDQLPPSYESLYGQIRAARDDSTGTFEFFKKFTVIVVSTIGCTFFVGILIAIPVSMIVMGSIYINDCPRQQYIPIYLIVGGCAGVLKTALSLGQRIKNRVERRDNENIQTNPLDGTLNCFVVCWFIAGNIWIYSIANDYSTDPTSPKYCNEVLFQYAFWMTTGLYIFLISTWLLFCVIGTACASLGSNS